MNRPGVLILIALGFTALGLDYAFLGAFLLTAGVSLYVAVVEWEAQVLNSKFITAVEALDKRQDAAQDALEITGKIAVTALKAGCLAKDTLEYDITLRPELKSFYDKRRAFYEEAEQKARDEAAEFRKQLAAQKNASPSLRA